MKTKLFTFSLICAGLMTLSCKEEEGPIIAEKGPEMVISHCTEKVNMGSNIKFTVDLKDNEFDLSTLKARLLFDETPVSSITIRTKENGTYENVLSVPLLKDIPDGTATIEFVAQNVGTAITTEKVAVQVTRPNPETITLEDAQKKEYTMTRVSDYQYEYTAVLPKDFRVFAKVPAMDAEAIVLGWNGSELAVNAKEPIPYSASEEAEYTVTLDLAKLTASPFNKIIKVESSLSKETPSENLQMKQNRVIEFKQIQNIQDWELDRDFFKKDENKNILFLAVDGKYKLTGDFKNQYIKVEPLDEKDQPLTLGKNCEGGLWMIGANFGKPAIGPNWNTTDGVYAAAQILPKVFQITFNAGSQLNDNASIKFFHQKGWGGEFKSYTKVEDATALFKVTNSGNIELASGKALKSGKAYQFTVDLTKGVDQAKLNIQEVDASEGKALDIKINGVKATKLSRTLYKVKAIQLKKNEAIQFSGIENPMEWYIDQDHFKIEGNTLKFNAVNGWYSIELNLADKFVTVRRVKENGKPATFVEDGAITIMGWGLAHPYMTTQLAWDSGMLITLAEVEEGKYQFTGKAVKDKSTVMGGRIRYNDMSFKLFGQAGWGVEMSKEYTIAPGAAALGFVNKGNIELGGKNNDSHLELDATYRMTFTFANKQLKDNKFTFTFDCVKL